MRLPLRRELRVTISSNCILETRGSIASLVHVLGLAILLLGQHMIDRCAAGPEKPQPPHQVAGADHCASVALVYECTQLRLSPTPLAHPRLGSHYVGTIEKRHASPETLPLSCGIASFMWHIVIAYISLHVCFIDGQFSKAVNQMAKVIKASQGNVNLVATGVSVTAALALCLHARPMCT